MQTRPFLALTLGDPSGIGPEVVAAALSSKEVRSAARLALIGPPSLRATLGSALAGAALESTALAVPEEDLPPDSLGAGAFARRIAESLPHGEPDLCWIDVETPGTWVLGRAQATAGRAALAALRVGAALAQHGIVDGLVTAPVCKQALHMAGEHCEGQTELLGRWSGTEEIAMLAVAKKLRVLFLTRHLPLSDAISRIDTGGVVRHLRLLQRGMQALGFPNPRLALAGLNPHAGEAGILGSEEIELLEPALQIVRREGLDVEGPVAPDTVFFKASRGDFDAVLALYHDQGFIPIKLHAPDDGVTVLLGAPFLRVSPAHGTAFDIVGRGLARHQNMVTAILRAAEWSLAWRPRSALGA